MSFLALKRSIDNRDKGSSGKSRSLSRSGGGPTIMTNISGGGGPRRRNSMPSVLTLGVTTNRWPFSKIRSFTYKVAFKRGVLQLWNMLKASLNFVYLIYHERKYPFSLIDIRASFSSSTSSSPTSTFVTASSALASASKAFALFPSMRSLTSSSQMFLSTQRAVRPKHSLSHYHQREARKVQMHTLKRKKKTLVLDLDETLIHSSTHGIDPWDFRLEVLLDRRNCLFYVYKRPHLDLFLKKVLEWYQVVIFTASLQDYADPVIDFLDDQPVGFAGRLFRQDCQPYNGAYIKDLTLIERDLAHICIVDNSPISYLLQSANAIPIEGWVSGTKDEALLDLLPFLDALRFTEDVRSILGLRLFSSTAAEPAS